MVLYDLGQIPQEDQDSFKTLVAQLLDLVLQKGAPQNWHHRLRPIIRDRPHSGATSTGKDDRLCRPIIDPAFDTRVEGSVVEGGH